MLFFFLKLKADVLCLSACQIDIHGKIREVLAETVRDGQDPAPSRLEFISALQRRGIIDDVMKDLHFTQVDGGVTSSNMYLVCTKKCFHDPRMFRFDRTSPQRPKQDLHQSKHLILLTRVSIIWTKVRHQLI